MRNHRIGVKVDVIYRTRPLVTGINERQVPMPSWLLLILVGVVLIVLGVATEIGSFLIWIGVVVLVISLILSIVGRGRNRA